MDALFSCLFVCFGLHTHVHTHTYESYWDVNRQIFKKTTIFSIDQRREENKYGYGVLIVGWLIEIQYSAKYIYT